MGASLSALAKSIYYFRYFIPSVACMCVYDGNFIKWAHASSSLFNQLRLHCFVLLPNFLFPVTVLISWKNPKIFDNFWSILLTNS